jgi:PAS domain S-box-containing protein
MLDLGSALWHELFTAGSFIPHGHCYLWRPGLVWLHLLSDGFITIAYYSIPLTLLDLVQQRTDLPFNRIFFLFSAFIVACGTTHLLEIWTLWHPIYWLSGLLKAGTALISITTAIVLVQLIPQALALPSPAQLAIANQDLQTQINERQRAEVALQQSYAELEIRVQARTAELSASNAALQVEIAERVRVEAQLQAIATLQQAILNSANYIIVATTVAGIVHTFNAAAERQIGYAAHEVIGQTPLLWHDWDEVEQRSQALATELGQSIAPGFATFTVKAQQGAVDAQEWICVRRDGSRFPMLLSVTSLRDHQGNLTGFVGIGSDITEQKQAQAALQQYTEQIEDLYNQAPCGYHSLDSDGIIVQINDTALKWLGYCREAMVGQRHFTELLTAPGKATFAATFATFKEHGWVHDLEFDLVCQDGSHLPVLLSATAVRDATGNFLMSRSTLFDISARKQAEQDRAQLLAQEQAARIEAEQTKNRVINILESITDAFFTLDHEWRFTYVNSEAEHLLRQPQAALMGQSIWQVFPDLVAMQIYQAFHRAASDQVSIEFEEYYPPYQIWIETQVYPTSEGLVIYAQNITERKQAIEELRRSEERWQLILKGTNDGIWDANLQTRQTFRSDRWCHILGYANLQELGDTEQSWLDRLHPDDRERVLQTQQDYLDRKTPFLSQEYRLRCRDGQYKWTLERAQAVWDETGRPLRLVGSSADITARKQAEAEILNLNKALESAVVGIAQLDPEGNYRWVNPATATMMGYLPAAMVGLNWRQIVRLDQHELVLSAYAHMMLEGRAEVEVLALRCDQTQFALKMVLVKAQDAQQNFIGNYAFTKDVSDRHEVQRLKDEFVAIVSHELRTPLTAISGALDLLAAGVLQTNPTEAQRMLTIAANNTDRLIRMINDILDIERIESGVIAMTKQICDVANLMAETVASVQELAQQAGVTVCVTDVSATVWVDSDRIIQVLTNLLSNAIKFSLPHSTIYLSAELRQKGDPFNPTTRPNTPTHLANSPMVLFQVRDLGRGIPANRLEAIFERFQQVDTSDARQKGGTGLGLAICRSILQQHDGQIWAESTVGQGSTFYFTLPLAWPGDSPVGAAINPQAPLLLVCDDDFYRRSMWQTLLEQQGYRVITAASEATVISQATAHFPDAILLNLAVPSGDGLDLLTILKQQPNTQNIPVLILRGLFPDLSLTESLAISDWFSQPAQQEKLRQALEQSLCKPSRNIKILIVEDDQDLAEVLLALFTRCCITAYHARTGQEAIHLSQQVLPDLLILDLVLPEGDGFSVVEWLQQHNRLHQVPLVIYTAHDVSDCDRQRLKLGPTLFLTKGRISSQELEQRVVSLLNKMLHQRA